MRYRFTIFVLNLAVLLSLRGNTQPAGVNGSTEVIILHVNDMHSKIDNLAKLAYLKDSLRKINPYTFLVAAGDNFTGNPVVDMVPETGFPMVDLMNRCGFDLSCVGNHEFDMGQEMLNKRIAQAKFPFICANMDASSAIFRQPEPWALLTVDSATTLAFLGLLQLDDNGLPSAHPSNLKNLKFVRGIDAAGQYLWLREKYKNLVALSHLGVDTDRRLADRYPQFDIIIGGHSHTLLETPVEQNGVMIAQTGANLKYAGKLTLKIQNGSVISRKGEVIPFSALKKEDGEIRRLIDHYNNNKEFAKVVGTAARPLNGHDELGSLMTDALTHELKVDFAFQNKGGIRIFSLEQGPITLKDVYKLDPFNNQVVIYSMTPDEIRSLICYGYGHENGIDLQVSGMTYVIRGLPGGKCDVTMRDRNGKKLKKGHEYTVAINSYMAYTYKFDHRDPGTLTTLTTAGALLKYLGVSGNIDYSGVKRATAKP